MLHTLETHAVSRSGYQPTNWVPPITTHAFMQKHEAGRIIQLVGGEGVEGLNPPFADTTQRHPAIGLQADP